MDRINETDTKHANTIPESSSELIFNSITRIEYGDKIGTGFFMKIVIKDKIFKFLVTCEHVVTEEMIKNKTKINIYYGKKNFEINKIIELNEKERYIKDFKVSLDITLIQILKSDNIPENKFLSPDLNYRNGYHFYRDKSFYLAGYPHLEEKDGIHHLEQMKERCISSGKITSFNEYEFEHSLDARSGSSGSPICLINNKCIIGIHKHGNKKEPINYGTFIGIVLDEIEKDKNLISNNFESNDLKTENNLNIENKLKNEKDIINERLVKIIRAIEYMLIINLRLLTFSKKFDINYFANGIVILIIVMLINKKFLFFFCSLIQLVILINIFFFDKDRYNTFCIIQLFYLRAYIKQSLILRLIKYDYFIQHHLYDFRPNYFLFIIIPILKMILKENIFEKALFFFCSINNIIIFIAFFKYNNILKLNNQEDFLCDKKSHMNNKEKNVKTWIKSFFLFLFYFILDIGINIGFYLPSYLYKNEFYQKLVIFCLFNVFFLEFLNN